MNVELTTDQTSTLLDALEQWEDGLDIEMQGDELAEARKDLHALKEVLLAALVKRGFALVRENAEHLTVKLFGAQA